jgi:hypothetical protein
LLQQHLLDQLLGLDVGHTVHTGDTITVVTIQSAKHVQLDGVGAQLCSIGFVNEIGMVGMVGMDGIVDGGHDAWRLSSLLSLPVAHEKSRGRAPPMQCIMALRFNLPDGKDAASLGQVGLLRDTTDSLLQDGGDLSGRGLGLGVGSGLDGEGGCGISGLEKPDRKRLAEGPTTKRHSSDTAPTALQSMAKQSWKLS